MPTTVQVVRGDNYRSQLDRVRRFLARLEDQTQDEVVYQDMAWSFFQHCWHLTDWIKHDPLIPEATKKKLRKDVFRTPVLNKICRSIAVRSKHVKADDPNAVAQHVHTETVFTGDVVTSVDIVLDSGNGTRRRGLDVAQECVAAWEAILRRNGLATGPRE